MKPSDSTRLLLSLIVIAPVCHSEAAVINVVPGTNSVTIQRVVYTINGNDVIQTTEATGVNNVGDTEVSVKSIRINNGGVVDLEYINNAGATVLNVNPGLASISGIGVFDNGVSIPTNGGLEAFATAMAATTTNSDLRNFSYYDSLSPGPPTPGVPDYDLVYVKAMQPNDYLLVSERFGNTYFEVTPLDMTGSPISGANVLRFGGSVTGPGYSVYDWNTGYAAAGNQPTQAQAFTVASVSKFFEGTSVTPGAVYGFRIDNDGEADTKILVMGDNPFEDNPPNPMLVPEPSTCLFSLGSCLGLLLRRNRRK